MNLRPKRYALLKSVIAAAALGGGTQLAVAQTPSFVLADFMNDVVMAAANVLWESVYPDSGPNGEEVYVGPDSEEGWQKVLDAAQSLVDAASQLQQMPSDFVVRDPNVEYETPTGELTPEAIADLIRSEPAAWSAHSEVLRSTANQALTAVQQRDLEALYDVTGVLDAPCTACHSQFWYPGQGEQ
mgnify:CR=1 FL=1|jgi:Cytochrome C''.